VSRQLDVRNKRHGRARLSPMKRALGNQQRAPHGPCRRTGASPSYEPISDGVAFRAGAPGRRATRNGPLVGPLARCACRVPVGAFILKHAGQTFTPSFQDKRFAVDERLAKLAFGDVPHQGRSEEGGSEP
jgi:hypothetical protein